MDDQGQVVAGRRVPAIHAVAHAGVVLLNLSARKSRALAEIYRGPGPGGRICMADLAVEGELPPEVANDQSTRAG